MWDVGPAGSSQLSPPDNVISFDDLSGVNSEPRFLPLGPEGSGSATQGRGPAGSPTYLPPASGAVASGTGGARSVSPHLGLFSTKFWHVF